MLNHFRSKLLNLPYESAKEHIPQDYAVVQLPDGLRHLYDVLFPPQTSRYYRLFLVNNYLNVINAAGYTDEVTAFDPRISYDLADDQYFKINRFSNPKISNIKFPIFVAGKLSTVKSNSYFYDSFLIRQVSNSANVTIYSRVNGVYLKGNDSFTDSSSAEIALTFGTSVSEPINIGKTGISVVFGAGETFTDTSNKTWEFLAEAPYEFEFEDIVEKVKILDPFKLFKKYGLDLTKFENIWTMHYNPVYRFAAFLLAYGTVVNSL